MSEKIQLVLVFGSVIIGVLSAAYFYLSTEIFLSMLGKPLKFVAFGMFVITLGILMGAFISYESAQGVHFVFYSVPLEAYYYILYLIGSAFILVGARKFTHRPKN